MDKWYISDNGRVAGPLNIDDVQRLIAKNSDVYGWNPSYSHWLPVIKINELKEFLPQDHSSDQVSKKLIDKFVNRKRDLNKKTALINSSIELTVEKMVLFEQEINKYKTLTATLSPDVQENIVPLEKKYHGIGKQLNDLQKALTISKQEINDAVKDFGELVLNKSTENYEDFAEIIQTIPTPAAPAPAQTISTQAAAKVNVVAPAPITVKSPETVRTVVSSTTETEISETSKPIPANIPLELRRTVVEHGTNNTTTKPSVVPINKDMHDPSLAIDNQSNQPAQTEKMGFKNKLKSVFSKQNNSEELTKLSDRLRLLDKEVTEKVAAEKISVDQGDDEEVVLLDYDVESESEDDSENKKKRRRRRRV